MKCIHEGSHCEKIKQLTGEQKHSYALFNSLRNVIIIIIIPTADYPGAPYMSQEQFRVRQCDCRQHVPCGLKTIESSLVFYI